MKIFICDLNLWKIKFFTAQDVAQDKKMVERDFDHLYLNSDLSRL